MNKQRSKGQENLFVIAPNDHQWQDIQKAKNSVSHLKNLKIKSLLDVSKTRFVATYHISSYLQEAREILHQHKDQIGGVANFWDYPLNLIPPVLNKEFGLNGPSLSSVLKCEHKYLAREVQNEIVPEVVPGFAQLDPYSDRIEVPNHITYPFWIKPVISYASHLAYRITNQVELWQAIREIRKGLPRLGNPFRTFKEEVDFPKELHYLVANTCLLENEVSGHQCTVEGYVYDNEVVCYGLIDSFRSGSLSSFSRYQYPSKVSSHIRNYLYDISTKVVKHIGYNNGTFNIEFFVNEEGEVWLLEVNSRLSQSHAGIFELVHGINHYPFMLDIALGKRPQNIFSRGPWPMAAKLFIREFEPGTIKKVPSSERIKDIESTISGTYIQLDVKEGTHVGDLHDQDSYSYELGHILIGGKTENDITSKFKRCEQSMNIILDPDKSGKAVRSAI